MNDWNERKRDAIVCFRLSPRLRPSTNSRRAHESRHLKFITFNLRHYCRGSFSILFFFFFILFFIYYLMLVERCRLVLPSTVLLSKSPVALCEQCFVMCDVYFMCHFFNFVLLYSTRPSLSLRFSLSLSLTLALASSFSFSYVPSSVIFCVR